MSSGTLTPPQTPDTPVPPPTEYEVVIERRLRETTRHVKGVDLAGGLLTLSIGVLTFLLLAAVTDHWLIAGGLGFGGRLVFWVALVGMTALFFLLRIVPPLVHRINPVFAAATIENSQHSLKNSLINFLMLRGRRQEVAPPVYQAVEYRAAADLSRVELDTAIDRTHVIRLGYVLVAVLAIFSLYLVFSPKNPIRSAVRVLWPWSGVEAPTRVTIRGVQPGNAVAFHDDSIAVSAEVSGLREGESVLLRYSTLDGQSVDQAIPMKRPEGEYRYQCRLPSGEPGLQQDLEYYLTAGDYRTPNYRVRVQIAPAIVVDTVSYHFPAYTGIADRAAERQGDLQAIEGTEVTIQATTNTDIKPGSAVIDLGCTGRDERSMAGEGRTAVGHLTLGGSSRDAVAAKFDSYQLRFADASGRPNTRPVRYRIDVIRDMPPTVELVEPQSREVQVSENGKLAIRVRAEDPDFALRRVTLFAKCRDKSLPIPPLLDKKAPEKAWQGAFSATYSFVPSQFGLKADDRVQYWAEAEDNKEPAAGRSATADHWITVVRSEGSPQSQQTREETQQGDRKPSDKDKSQQNSSAQQPSQDSNQNESSKDASADKQPSKDSKPNQDQNNSAGQNKSGSQSDSSQSGQKGGKSDSGNTGQEKAQQTGQSSDGQQTAGQQQGSKSATKPNERIDPETDPGDAIQEILKDRQQQQGQSGNDQSNSNDQQPGKQADKNKPNEQQSADGKTKGQDSGNPTSSTGTENEKLSTDKRPADKGKTEQSGSQKSPESNASGQQETQQQPGGSKPDAQSPTQEKPNADTSGGMKSGTENGGKQQKPSASEPQSGDKKSTEQQVGDKKPGEQPQGEMQSPGDGKKADDHSGSPTPQGQNQPRDKKPGESNPSQEQQTNNQQQSPSQSEHQSDSKGETAGDRSGDGEHGGGQQAKQPDVGGPGSHTPADQGSSTASQRGDGEAGPKAGDQSLSPKPTGSDAKAQASEGEGAAQKPPSDRSADGKPPQPDNSGQGGTRQPIPPDGAAQGKKPTDGSVPHGLGNQPGIGGNPGDQSGEAKPSEPTESTADDANIEYARRQTELALEYLRNQVAKDKPKLLDRLGWTKDDARRFLDRWEQMQRAAAQQGPEGADAKKQLSGALQSLGLRERGTELRHDSMIREQPNNLRDAGRFAPPPDWLEQFREYNRGINSEESRKPGK